MRIHPIAAGLAILAGLAASPASAQQLIGGGDNAQVAYPTDATGNVLGGGRVRVTNGVSGGLSTTYLEPMPQGRLVGPATLSGGAENAAVVYGPANAGVGQFAQRAR